MKNILKYLFLLMMFTTSCSDYLNVDDYFDDEFKLDSTFTQSRYVKAYMWGMVTMIPDESYTVRYNHTPGPIATDEAVININEGGIVYNGTNFSMGFTTPDAMRELDSWQTYYRIIRIANTILNRMNEAPDMTYADKREIEGYTRFFRAYAYYNLLINFGPPILLGDEVVNNNEPLEYYDRERATYDETVDFITSEMDNAAMLMPLTVSTMDFGRPTRGSAMAISARLKLYHASPAFNGGEVARRYYSTWKRKSDGVNFIQQTFDERRWAVAAAAAEEIIAMQNEGRKMYNLYVMPQTDATHQLPTVTGDPNFNTKLFPEGAAGIDHYRSYSELFSGECAASTVSEFIWARRSNYCEYGLKGSWSSGVMPKSLGGWGRWSVTQKLVDAYRMDDGRTIDEAKSDGYYSEQGFLTDKISFSGYRLMPGTSNMYVGREMRFYASIGFNNCLWDAASCTEAPLEDGSGARDHIANYYSDGWDGKYITAASLDYSITGLVCKKYIHQMDSRKGSGARMMDKVYPIVRYAEILLNYAEALNNLTSSFTIETNGVQRTVSRDANKILTAFNQVRYRAGLPGLTSLPSREEFQKLLQQERMVEFTHENHRYFDVRRWGIYEETEREPMQGMNVEASSGNREAFYRRTVLTGNIRGRVVDRKLMFVPIPRDEIRRLPSLAQNPGWE
ncbi:MAG: RagB/SusD family nutrient uptake outer membrane protein [Tannerella sp.]|jgi:hypothetical protein|nr:RagB/SusD family nutrient uptake outer membrane protein [Tannerella sp.]